MKTNKFVLICENLWFKKRLFGVFLLLFCAFGIMAQSTPSTGTQNRVVTFARFNGDPDIDTPRPHFESMFNGENNSLKSYFQAISNNKLTINSLMYPATTEPEKSYELKYSYYCYDSSWKGSYPNCKGSDISSLFDVNIGFIIKELVTDIENSGNMPDGSLIDSNNDGYVDNFVIIFRGAARGMGKGVYTPQVGSVASVFTNTHGDITLNGKIIKNYTITFERNSLETHCRFLLSDMGFPNQYRNVGTLPRAVGAWDPMDGPQLSYPLVYNRMKYTNSNWISDIPQITEPGTYTLSSADNETNNAYWMQSSVYGQYWVLEYRDNTVAWDTNVPEAGLIIYRVNTAYTGSVTRDEEVYLYRKDGTPTEKGDILDAPFSEVNGRTAFSATSNPFPFLSDGTTSSNIDISNIRFDGDKMSFTVNNVYVNSVIETGVNDWKVFVNQQTVEVEGEGIERIDMYDISGRLLITRDVSGNATIDVNHLPDGIYIVNLSGKSTKVSVKIVLR